MRVFLSTRFILLCSLIEQVCAKYMYLESNYLYHRRVNKFVREGKTRSPMASRQERTHGRRQWESERYRRQRLGYLSGIRRHQHARQPWYLKQIHLTHHPCRALMTSTSGSQALSSKFREDLEQGMIVKALSENGRQ
jgi:hypothetical protein